MKTFHPFQTKLFHLSFAVFLILLNASGSPVHAMRFELTGDTLILSGPVVDDDLPRMRDVLKEKRARQILLHQSPGGDAWTALRMGHEIRSAGLNTLLSGQCASACGLLFLAGVNRSLSDGMPVRQNRLLLHGAWDLATGRTLPEKSAELAAYIRKMTAEKYPESLMQMTVNPAQAQDFMEFAITPRMLRAGQPRGVFQCLVKPDRPRECKELEGFSAFNTGVITEEQIFVLDQVLRERLDASPR